MTTRLNQDRERVLQPKRIQYSIKKLTELGFEVKQINDNEINFEFKGKTIRYFPYSGWATGSTIKDGRGFNKLLIQLT